ncbi:MAG: SBBP repeat-containing protein, partial [bacterium]
MRHNAWQVIMAAGLFAALSTAAVGQVDTAWVRRYQGPGDWKDGATALAVDGQGNVYVTGYSEGLGTGPDYATIKYSPDGEELWVTRYAGPEVGQQYPTALAVDGQGNVYVTGSCGGWGTWQDYATVKYSPDGEELWLALYDGPASYWDQAYALVLDGQGNVYV